MANIISMTPGKIWLQTKKTCGTCAKFNKCFNESNVIIGISELDIEQDDIDIASKIPACSEYYSR